MTIYVQEQFVGRAKIKPIFGQWLAIPFVMMKRSNPTISRAATHFVIDVSLTTWLPIYGTLILLILGSFIPYKVGERTDPEADPNDLGKFFLVEIS